MSDLPPRVARALKLLGYDTLERARARLRLLGGRFVVMSSVGGSDFEPLPGFAWGEASTSHRVTMTEKDFALFGLFASVGLEILENPLVELGARPALLPSGDPADEG